MDVRLYSTPTCPWCRKAKEFLKANNVKFEDINVADNREKAQEMIQKSGQMGVPVIDAGGKIIVGFNEDELRKALGL